MASERDLADGGKPKQTLFISLLNGTEEDMETLYNAFTSVPDLERRRRMVRRDSKCDW